MREAHGERSFSKHNRLLHSCSLLSVLLVTCLRIARHKTLLLPMSFSGFELWTRTGVAVKLMFNLTVSSPPLLLPPAALEHLRLSSCADQHQQPFNIRNMRDVTSDERRKKISKMSSLMSNTKCELSLFPPPPPPPAWLLSGAVTLAV